MLRFFLGSPMFSSFPTTETDIAGTPRYTGMSGKYTLFSTEEFFLMCCRITPCRFGKDPQNHLSRFPANAQSSCQNILNRWFFYLFFKKSLMKEITTPFKIASSTAKQLLRLEAPSNVYLKSPFL